MNDSSGSEAGVVYWNDGRRGFGLRLEAGEGLHVACTNKKAWRDYHIDETIEAGIVLRGSEVKSLRDGTVNLSDSYALPKNGELFLLNVHIGPFKAAKMLGSLIKAGRIPPLIVVGIDNLLVRKQQNSV